MDAHETDPLIREELRSLIDKSLAAGDFLSKESTRTHLRLFRSTFGPDILASVSGEALLKLLHGRQDPQSRCLAYWLEFKDDDEFRGRNFGGIGGGSALKFGLYQRPTNGEWVTGSANSMRSLSTDEAIAIVQQQRDELLAGDKALSAMDPSDLSDQAYAALQKRMGAVAPNLSGSSWAHKYWYLVHSDQLEDYHVPYMQRYQLLKLLQIPPDGRGVLDYDAGRFVCGGRFAALARSLDVPVSTLTSALNRRHGSYRAYWRVGTTVGKTGESQWEVMRNGGFVSVGFESIPNLVDLLPPEKAKARDILRQRLVEAGRLAGGVAAKKAGELLNFFSDMSEMDLVIACDGMRVLGIGQVAGPYEYDSALRFPHKRPVRWLSQDEWQLPEKEALQTTFVPFGKSAMNLLELEKHVFDSRNRTPPGGKPPEVPGPLPSLDPFTARLESILARKLQAILYGPPGTGKTFKAISSARELASRKAFNRSFDKLNAEEKAELEQSDHAMVRLCTFHPGYGYEDFIEGYRPKTPDGRLVFVPVDGIFKQLCTDATARQDRNYFLVIDEINRGDIPRIFGELLTVIECDKRGRSVILPVSGRSFSVPRNVFVIGTMNTADRSISLLDAALRRRFGFVELMPDSSVLGQQTVGDLRLGAWLDALNLRLRRHLKRDARNLQVGHAYLMPPKPITSIAEFARVLRDDIIPLLEDYCYEDFATLREILGQALIDVEMAKIREELFEPELEVELIQAVSFEEMQPLLLGQKDQVEEPGEQEEPASA